MEIIIALSCISIVLVGFVLLKVSTLMKNINDSELSNKQLIKSINDTYKDFKKSITSYEKTLNTLNIQDSKQRNQIASLLQENKNLKTQLSCKEQELKKLSSSINEFKVIKKQESSSDNNIDRKFIIKKIPSEIDGTQDDYEEGNISIDDLEEKSRIYAENTEDWSESYDDLDGAYWADHMGGYDPEDNSNRF